MRNLALSMVGDAERAEDLTQETWIRALEHPPSLDGPVRGWLATVMQNLFRQERRGRVRGADRESQVAGEEASQGRSSSELLARVSMQRELVELVLALDEPYRKVVLLRFFEELSPKRIAEQEGLPIATVKTQLSRGLERLRERLDSARDGDGRAWLTALVPLLRQPAGLASSNVLPLVPLGALLMNAKVVVTVLILSAIGTGYLVSLPEVDEVKAEKLEVAQPGETEELQTPDSTETPLIDSDRSTSAREEVDVQSPIQSEIEPPTSAGAAAVMVSGRVVNLNGLPIGGLSIASSNSISTRGTRSLATSAEDGAFQCLLANASRLWVIDDHFTTVMAGVPDSGATEKEILVVVAPLIELAGRVIDEYGNLVGGARVELKAPHQLRRDIGWGLDFSQEVRFVTESGVDGHFEFPNAPGFVGGVLRATADGYVPYEEAAPEVSSSTNQLVMVRPTLSGNLLTGQVIDELGVVVPNAYVSMGVDTTRTDAAGGFVFDLADPKSSNRIFAEFPGEFSADKLIAIKPGFLPGEQSARGIDEDGRPIWPDHVVLRIGGEPLAISGRVVDTTGSPLAGMRVWIEDPTFFGGLREEGKPYTNMSHVETMLIGHDPSWSFVETSGDGEFRLEGLLDRNYAVGVMDPKSLTRAREESVQAGRSGVEIELSYEETWETVRGLVVDGRGTPVAGASVRVTTDAFRTIVGKVVQTQHASGSETTTDADGQFELSVVPKEYAYFRVDHPDSIPLELGRSEQALRGIVGEDYDEFTLVISRRCHFKIELSSSDEADSFQMLDAEGAPLSLSEFRGNGRRDGFRFEILGGQTNVFAVSDTAVELVLYLEGAEVRREPVDLVPGEQTTLR